MNISFTYNLDKDIKNFLIGKMAHANNPSRRQALFEEKYGKEMDPEKLKKFILDYSKEKNINFEERAKFFQKTWGEVNDEFFRRMENIFKAKLPAEEIIAYLTINDRCGYNPGRDGQWYFFISASCKDPRRLSAHEIFHFYTHLCFGNWLKEKGLSPQEFYDLKESLAEILNLEFNDLSDGKDFANADYQIPMRQKIVELWQKEKDIKKVIDEMIKDKTYEKAN